MVKKLLKPEDCASCRYCCKFDDTDKLDAPAFTESEVRYIQEIRPNIQFRQREGVFQIVLEQQKDLYICPLLTDQGCLLGERRPFDCKSWPFYLMRRDDGYVVALSQECPVIVQKSQEEIRLCIDETFLSICRDVIRSSPGLITEYDGNLEIVYQFKESEPKISAHTGMDAGWSCRSAVPAGPYLHLN